MPQIALATGAYRRKSVGLPDKICENAYIERSGTQPDAQMQIVTRWGSLALTDWIQAVGTDEIRGMMQADGFAGGKILAVVGNVLRTYNPTGGAFSTIPGTISGSDRVRWAFTETEMGIVAGGRFYVSNGTITRDATDSILDDPNLAIGSTNTRVATGAFDYSINGTLYAKAAVAAGTIPGNDVVPIGTYGAVALDIGIDGTIDAVEAPANATGYASAALAAAALPAVELEHVRIGYVTASKSDGAFTFGTTALNAANTTVAYTDTTVETAWTDLLADHGETAFIDIAAIGQRFVLLYGSRFAFSEVLDGNTSTALSYYTAEYSPDGLVGVANVNNRIYLFGSSTTEPWEETGDADNPFRRSLGQEFSVGCRARDSIRIVNTVPYWVDQHNQVVRLGNAIVPEILSGPDISKEIAATEPTDMLGFVLEAEGHAWYGLRLPTMCPLFDANYGEWSRYLTNLTDTWRYGFILRVSGSLYVGDAEGVGFARMAETYKSEHMPGASTMGTEIVGQVSGYILANGTRKLGRLRWEGSKGVGLSTGQGSAPVIRMRRSLKGPGMFSSYRSREIGAQGEYATSVEWNQMGHVTAPGCVIELSWSDPVAPITTGLFEDAS